MAGEGYLVFDQEDGGQDVNLFEETETEVETFSDEGLMEADSFDEEEVDNQPATGLFQVKNVFDDSDEEETDEE